MAAREFRVMRAVTILRAAALGAVVVLASCGQREVVSHSGWRGGLPAMAWDHRPEAEEWTQAILSALSSHGAALAALEPSDVDRFCPAYRGAGTAQRQAFWAGLFSALAKHESTWNPRASGGGGAWLGLLQIDPRTARGYGCAARSRGALFDGSKNLSCGVRIAAKQVPRDNEIVGGSGRWRGLARDWAPFRSSSKLAEMIAYTRAQDYCRG